MPWQKGQSGNPNGRPKGYAELEKLARTHTEAAINALVAGLDGKYSVAAAQALLDRGWGRPMQRIEANVNVLEHLSDGTLDRLASLIADGEDDAAFGSEASPSRSEAHH